MAEPNPEKQKLFEFRVKDQERLEQTFRAMGMTKSGYLEQIIEAHVEMAEDMDGEDGGDDLDTVPVYISEELWDSYVAIYEDPERGPDYDDPADMLEAMLQRVEGFLTDL